MSRATPAWLTEVGPPKLADEVATENLKIARWLPAGTVVDRRLDGILVPAAAFYAPRHPKSGSARLRAKASIPRWMLFCTSQYFSSRYPSSAARSGS